jgi:hypothetical protein
MRHCGEIGKRDGEGVIGQNTNGRFEYSFWAHCRDGIASLRARERRPQRWIAGNMGVALLGSGDRLVPHIWIHGDGACRRNLPKCSRTDGSLLISASDRAEKELQMAIVAKILPYSVFKDWECCA